MSDTIMAPLTPVEISPVITLRASGDVLGLLKFFAVSTGKIEPRIATRAAYNSASNSLIKDDVLLLYFKAPASYTGEDILEISFHGNPLIVNAAMSDFTNEGVRIAERGEFTKRAYLNRKITLAQAEAVNAIIHAPTPAGVGIASRSLHGEVDEIFYKLRSELLSLLTQVEAAIDFSEELHELHGVDIPAGAAIISMGLKELTGKYNDIQRLIRGVRVVIAGAPNAGKSTLFNLLLGSDRAIVSDEEGTTRDLLSEQLHLGGVHIVLTDTAGVRKAASASEKEGIRRAIASTREADLLLILVDLSVPLQPDIQELIENSSAQAKIIVGTKADLPKKNNIQVDKEVSALDAQSISALKKDLSEAVAGMLAPDHSGPALVAERQRIECELCLKELSEIRAGQTLDIQAYHLRKAAEALDRAQGGMVAEQMLDNIFANFCIGK